MTTRTSQQALTISQRQRVVASTMLLEAPAAPAEWGILNRGTWPPSGLSFPNRDWAPRDLFDTRFANDPFIAAGFGPA